MKYILDFDRVIFDADAYRASLESQGLAHLFTDPRACDAVSVRTHVYPDALQFLRSCEPQAVTIISVMSPHRGPHARAYQKRKLEESGVHAFVREAILMEGEKGLYVKRVYDGSPTIFIDDTLAQLYSARQHCPGVRCVQMVRPGLKKMPELSTDPNIPTISAFSELDAIFAEM